MKFSGKTGASVQVGKHTSDEVNLSICFTEETRHKHFKSSEVLQVPEQCSTVYTECLIIMVTLRGELQFQAIFLNTRDSLKWFDLKVKFVYQIFGFLKPSTHDKIQYFPPFHRANAVIQSSDQLQRKQRFDPGDISLKNFVQVNIFFREQQQ